MYTYLHAFIQTDSCQPLQRLWACLAVGSLAVDMLCAVPIAILVCSIKLLAAALTV